MTNLTTFAGAVFPRFLCIRNDAGDIVEEKQFNRAEDVPADKGWELITPPVAASAQAAGQDVAKLAADLNEARLAAARATADNSRLQAFVAKAVEFANKIAASGAPDDVKAEAAALVEGLDAKPEAPGKAGKGKK